MSLVYLFIKYPLPRFPRLNKSPSVNMDTSSFVYGLMTTRQPTLGFKETFYRFIKRSFDAALFFSNTNIQRSICILHDNSVECRENHSLQMLKNSWKTPNNKKLNNLACFELKTYLHIGDKFIAVLV